MKAVEGGERMRAVVFFALPERFGGTFLREGLRG